MSLLPSCGEYPRCVRVRVTFMTLRRRRSDCRRGRMRHVLLPANWFEFIGRRSLRHALRHGDYLTLVTIRVSREYLGLTVDVGSQRLSELAEAIGPTIRGTDLTGELEEGRLGLLLSDADDVAAFSMI